MNAVDDFLRAAVVPIGSGHVAGDLTQADQIRAGEPALAERSLYAAAVLGDAEAVRRHLADDPEAASRKGGPHGWDALTHLCFSRYLRLDGERRSDGFLAAATALLDAGTDPDTGWYDASYQAEPVWESALYGAAGVAHHAGLTRLLLERGADPNDGETPYHAPEQWDLPTVQALVESGRVNDEGLGTILVRMADWHHQEGIEWMLERGIAPDAPSPFRPPLLHAVLRDNRLAIVELFLDHGADPDLEAHGVTPARLAARRGRRDVLEALDDRGMSVDLPGEHGLLAACARGDAESVQRLAGEHPLWVDAVRSRGAEYLGQFAGNGNADGVALLMALGVPVDARWLEGDGYFGIARDSTALHVAAWRAAHGVVRVLLDHGAEVRAEDGRARTPLQLAVLACVDSYWTDRRAPDSVRHLLDAGAPVDEGVRYPSGYAAVDALLEAPGAGSPSGADQP